MSELGRGDPSNERRARSGCAGLCEVENRAVVEAMLKQIKLPQREYKIVHHDSPDERGIDVAIVYDAKVLKLAGEKVHPVTIQTTRDILEAKLTWGNDVLYVFMNHWPSQNNPETDRNRCGQGFTDAR